MERGERVRLSGSYLPEDIVDGAAQETLSVVRGEELGSEYRHELLKVHLAVTWRDSGMGESVVV